MKYLLNYNIFNEALLPSQFRKYMEEFNRDRYEEKFQEFKKKYDGDRNAYRLYLPYESDIKKSKTELEIENLISENGYEIIDYIGGVAKFKDAKNPSKIGKVLNSILNKTEDKERVSSLIKKFIEDPIRKSGKEEMLVCISRHPYDIAGADTDRNWTNCMTIGTKSSNRLKGLEDQLSKLDRDSDRLKIKEIEDKISDIKRDGENSHYLINDVKEGSLISYLIKSTDKNINKPIANLNIKPYLNIDGDIILLSDDRMYGIGNAKFKKVVDDFLSEFNGNIKDGVYFLNNNVYNDRSNDIIEVSSGNPKKIPLSQIWSPDSVIDKNLNYVYKNPFFMNKINSFREIMSSITTKFTHGDRLFYEGTLSRIYFDLTFYIDIDRIDEFFRYLEKVDKFYDIQIELFSSEKKQEQKKIQSIIRRSEIYGKSYRDIKKIIKEREVDDNKYLSKSGKYISEFNIRFRMTLNRNESFFE